MKNNNPPPTICLIFFCWSLPRGSRVPQISLRSLRLREREREINFRGGDAIQTSKQCQQQPEHCFFGYTLTHSSIINSPELCHYIMEYGLTITTPGQVCHQFVFFTSPSEYPRCRGGQRANVGIVSSNRYERLPRGVWASFVHKGKTSEISSHQCNCVYKEWDASPSQSDG